MVVSRILGACAGSENPSSVRFIAAMPCPTMPSAAIRDEAGDPSAVNRACVANSVPRVIRGRINYDFMSNRCHAHLLGWTSLAAGSGAWKATFLNGGHVASACEIQHN
jgi:hypothetical protein